jgi:hypothetical protein
MNTQEESKETNNEEVLQQCISELKEGISKHYYDFDNSDIEAYKKSVYDELEEQAEKCGYKIKSIEATDNNRFLKIDFTIKDRVCIDIPIPTKEN